MSLGMGGRELTQLARTDNEKRQEIPADEPKKPDAVKQPIESPKSAPAPEPIKPAPGEKTPVVPEAKPDAKPDSKPEAVPEIKLPPQMPSPGNRRYEIGRPRLIAGFPSLLMRRERNQPTWARLPPEKGRVFATDQLLMLPGFRGDVRFDSGVQMLLWGNLPEFAKLAIPVLEAQVTINSQSGTDLDFSLERGRVLLSNHKKEGAALIRVRFGEEVWDLTLHDADTEVGLELLANCLPYARASANNEPDTEVALLVFKGEASLKVHAQEFLLQPNTIVMWDSVLGSWSRPSLLPRLPEWYSTKVLPTTAAAREASQALDNLSRMSTTKTLDVALGECLHANDAATRTLAIRCFAALSDVPALLNALNDDKHPGLRAAAVEGLRHLLGVSPNSERELERIAKEKNYSEKQIVTLRQLLQGFVSQQWAQPAVRTAVVDYLLHDKLVVRQLAYSLLLRMFPDGQRIGYDAGADERKRERAVEEWKALVVQPQKK